MIKNLIQQGSIITLNHFLHNYKELDEKKERYTYDPMYQPCAHYGNRFQAQPTWETEELNKYDSLDRQKAMFIKGLEILNDIYETI